MTASGSPEFVKLTPPKETVVDRPSVILYGTIDAPGSLNWRDQLTHALSDMPVAVLDPFRSDWDSSWVEDISCPTFKQQVEWEMDQAAKADVIAIYFGPGTVAPITLLELGLYASTGKAVVCCSPDFPKRGNVQIVCDRYNIPLYATLEDFQAYVRNQLST